MTPQEITIGIAAAAAVFALLAGLGALWSAWTAKKAMQAQLYSRFVQEYGSREMLRDLRRLQKWQSDHGERMREEYRSGMESKDKQTLDVDVARRRVGYYFDKALRLLEAGYVDEAFVRRVGNVQGINIMHDIVRELDAELNPRYSELRYDKLAILCPHLDSGFDLSSPIAPQPSRTAPQQSSTTHLAFEGRIPAMTEWKWPFVVAFGIVVAAIVIFYIFAPDQATRDHMVGYMDTIVPFVVGAAVGGIGGGTVGYSRGKRA
jgi:hypothetical protein